jgi:hypothetical protein
MGSILLFFLAAALFALSSRGLIAAIRSNTYLEGFGSVYSRRALSVEKGYKVMAWALLTAFLFFTTVQLFWQVFTSL